MLDIFKIFKQDHPRGLYLLFFVEMWERFSYYGMRALLVLYMIQHLMFTTEKAGNIYGLYTGFVYLTPILGGYLADRYIGQRKSITTGALFMCIGLFMLASQQACMFLPALFVMVIANGFFKSNISSVLGMLYGKNNNKKDSAFTIFYMGINIGAFLSPLVCGTLALRYGFGAGFASAGIGMLIGVIIYKLFENKYLGNCGLYPIKKVSIDNTNKETKLTIREKNRIIALFVLMIFTIVFWTCYEQAGCSLTLFAEYATNRNIMGHVIPAGYFQSLNPLYIIILAPMMSMFWEFLQLKRLEPTSVEKFTLALGLISVAYVIMAIAGDISTVSKVSPLWLIAAYFIMTVAELCISPIGLSLVSKLAPRNFVSVLMGTWFLSSFFGNLFAGVWGGKYGSISSCVLFLSLAGVSLVSAVVLACLLPRMKRYLGRV
ncbi:MAG: peptide MFS transporter [Candidatus Gastranaerophilales bacterium]|nr:peptide MFS transporter [Candidatus Gastranaerophilales bacterium]